MAKKSITHPDKLLFPKDKITKKEVIAYYEKVASLLLPHLKNRPLIMERFPNGISQKGFFHKNVSDYFPSWIATVFVKRIGKEKGELVLCNNIKTLQYLCNQGTISYHLWLSKKDKIDCPDRIIFDLDPPKNKFELVRKAAQELRVVLEEELQLSSFIMTTGSKGVHVIVPIKPTIPFKEVRAFAKKVATRVCKKNPKFFTTQPRKNQRKGKVFIDYLRNAYAQHAISPYSLRPLPKAPIATPIFWEELSYVSSQTFHMKNIGSRLKKNPWKSFFLQAKSLKGPLKKIDAFTQKP